MNLNQYSQSAAQPGLAVERIRNLCAPVPPIDEQEALVEAFKERTTPLVWAISRLEREIDLLREYRTRLVADVVTGKLDVREAAARLPDEEPLADFPVEEEESLEEDLIEDDGE
jgi:type I restriction enzyme S subunit